MDNVDDICAVLRRYEELEKFRRIENRWRSSISVIPGGCHVWVRGKNQSGYGVFSFRGKGRLAHRIAYELAHGPIPKGLLVRHKCDVTACVNVEHLELGTFEDNARDVKSRKRAKQFRTSVEQFGSKVRIQQCQDGIPECWIWTGSHDQDHPYFKYRGRQLMARRFAWTVYKQQQIPTAIWMKCKTPLCVNPAHMLDRGTLPKWPKYVPDEIVSYVLTNPKASKKSICDKFGVTRSQLTEILECYYFQ